MTSRREPETRAVPWFCARCLAQGEVTVSVSDTCTEVSQALDEAHAIACETCDRPRIVVQMRSPYPD